MSDDGEPRDTWIAPRVDQREVDLETAGAVFTSHGSRVLYREQLREAEARGFARGYDDHHRVCAELVEDVRKEDRRRHDEAEHRWNGRFQALLLELQETRTQLDQTQGALAELAGLVARGNAEAGRGPT